MNVISKNIIEPQIYHSTDILETIYSNAKNEKAALKNSGFGNESMFFIYYEVPKLNAFSYLFASEPLISPSNVSRVLKRKFSDSIDKILSPDEINIIVSTVIHSYNLEDSFKNLKELIKEYQKDGDEYYKDIPTIDNASILIYFLEAINKFDFSLVERLDEKILSKILYILFLSLPQPYAEIKKEVINRKKLKDKIIELGNKIVGYKDRESSFAEKIFLLSSILEGLLWPSGYLGTSFSNIFRINSDGKLEENVVAEDSISTNGDFVSVNIYEVLKKYGESYAVNPDLIYENSFYLKLFNFYIYSRNAIEEDTICKFINNNVINFIQLGKVLYPELNLASASYYRELLSHDTPKSIIHGLINIFSPLEIQVINRQFKVVEIYEKNDKSIDVTKYVDPWALYNYFIPKDKTEIISEKRLRSGISFTEKSILINTKFFSKQEYYILLRLRKAEDDIDSSEIGQLINNLKSHPFSLKEIIEKYSYIGNTVNYNVNNNEWFNKAFCELYKEFDEIRNANNEKQKPIYELYKYRDWEIPYFKLLLKKSNKVVVYDMGIGYGRFENKLQLELREEILDIEVFGFDISLYLINRIKDLPLSSDIFIGNFICDFRNINYIPKFIKNGQEKKPDIIFFNYTTFGYFKDISDNKSVLLKSLRILNPGGSLIIEQFHPRVEPEHVIDLSKEENTNKKIQPAAFNLKNKRLVKTSYYDSSNEYYTRYYGNYFYFSTEENQEKLIKCDNYDIRLFSPEWFHMVVDNDKKLNVNDFHFYCSDREFCGQENAYELDEYSTNGETSLVKSSQIIIRIEKEKATNPPPPTEDPEEQKILLEKIDYLINTVVEGLSLSDDLRTQLDENQKKISLNDLEFMVSNGEGSYDWLEDDEVITSKIAELIERLRSS